MSGNAQIRVTAMRGPVVRHSSGQADLKPCEVVFELTTGQMSAERGPVFRIVDGGVTGYESFYLNDFNPSSTKDVTWVACMGTWQSWDQLVVPDESMRKMFDYFGVVMNANAKLRRIRVLFERLEHAFENDRAEYDKIAPGALIELRDFVPAFDEWLTSGGELPDAWRRPAPAESMRAECERLRGLAAHRKEYIDVQTRSLDAAIARAESAEAKLATLTEQCQKASRVLVEQIGAMTGPEDISQTAKRAAEAIVHIRRSLR